jgi:hypothetical protein
MRRTQTRLLAAAALCISVAVAGSVGSRGAHAASMRRDGLCDVLRIVLPLDCGIVDPAAPPTDNGRTGPAPPQPAGPST